MVWLIPPRSKRISLFLDLTVEYSFSCVPGSDYMLTPVANKLREDTDGVPCLLASLSVCVLRSDSEQVFWTKIDCRILPRL